MSDNTIDRLSIEITSNSTGAKQSIEDIAEALGTLKQNGSVGTAVKNLERLGKVLGDLGNKQGATQSVKNLTSSLSDLATLNGKGINSLRRSLEKLQEIDLDKIQFDDEKIKRFATQIKKLDDEIGPLSTKMLAVSSAFKALDKNARLAGGGVNYLEGKTRRSLFTIANYVTSLQGLVSALMPIVRLLIDSITQAMEWDGIVYQFGNAFGEQADYYYEKITQITDALAINKQQFMESSAMITSMLQGFGVGNKDAREMGLGYTELAYDIWAAYNNVYKSSADAMTAIRSAVAGEVEPIRRAGFTIVESTLEQTAANHGLEISIEKATEAQKSYLRYLSLVDQAHTKGIVGAYATEMNTAEGLTRTLAQQVKTLAQSFGSLFLPVLTKILPWIQALVNLLTEAVVALASFFGITIQPVKWGSGFGSGVGDLNDSLDETTSSADSAKKAIEDMKNATLGIDELNVISPKNNAGSGSGSGSGGGGGSLGDLGIDTPWDQIDFESQEIQNKLKEALSGITAVVSGFALAIGTILVVTGANIPLGLGLMAVGAVGLVAVIAENWNGMSDKLAKTLTTVTSVLGGFLLAIGAFLAFSGVNVGLGAALMVAGAVSIATAATINWKFLEGDLKNTLAILTGIVSGGLLAMGALFAFTGVSVPLGIALMAGGAVGLVTAVGLNWNFLSEPMRKAIGALEAVVGGGLLALGAVMAFSGANLPLGITMIALGAVSLVSAIALNWDSLTGNVKNSVATITAIVSGALLGVGAVLAFCGVSMPLGISLMAAGAVGLVASAPINWKSLTETIKTVLDELGVAIGISFLAVGAILAFSNVAMPLGISLMAVGAANLVSAVALNWGSITDTIRNILKEIGMIIGGSLMVMGMILIATGAFLPLGIALLATGLATYASGAALNTNAIVDEVNRIVNDVGVAWGRLWDATKTGVKTMWDGVVGWFTDLWDTLVGHSIVPDTIDGIVECFTSLPGRVLSTVSKFVADIVATFSEFKVVNIAVQLVKSGWSTVKNWIGSLPSLGIGVSLFKVGWSTITNWIGSIPSLGIGVSLFKVGWSTVTNWIGSMPTLSASIKLVKSGWTTVKNWIGSMPTLSASIKLVKSGWTSVWNWIGTIPVLSQYIKLAKNAWSSVKSWIGYIPILSQKITLDKYGWTSVKKWIGDMPTLSASIKLAKDGWSSVKNWLGGLSYTLSFKLPKIRIKWGKKEYEGFTISYPTGFETYAKGGFPEMGEMFIAREAGPEMVGRIGNKTTVANNDQIVEGISEGVYSAVLAAMRASETNGSQSVNVYLDGRQITNSVEKRQRERGASLMGNQVYAY